MPWWPAVALWVVVGSVSAVATIGLLGFVAIKVTFFYLAIIAVLWLAPFDERDRDHLVSILMGMAALASFVGIAQIIVGPSFLVQLGYEYGRQVRTSGGFLRTFSTFVQPFPFGLYVMVALLVGGAVALAEPRRRRNLAFLCLTPIMVVAMASSIVRAAILGLVVGMVWLAILRFRALFLPLALGAAALAAVFPFVPSLSKVFLSSSSLGQRGAGWSDIISSIVVHPVGRGLGTSGSAADRISTASGVDIAGVSTNYQPDNYYVKMLLELGPVGLWLVLLWLVVALVWTTRLGRCLPGRDGALALGVSASIVAAMVASLVATYFEIFPIDVYFWLLLGVVGCTAAQHDTGSGPWPSGRAAAEYKRISVSSSGS
jgi:O-antigen ligase